MLGKLLKYDLKWIYKIIVIFYCLSFFFAVISRIFTCIENSQLFEILAKITSGCTIAMIVNCLINCIMRSWGRFAGNMYKDESYLTHTLPVTKNTIYLSKVIAGILCSLTTVLVLVLSLVICYYSAENMDAIKGMMSLAAGTYNTTVFKLLAVISAVVFLEIVFALLAGYLGIIIGHMSNKKKMAKSVIAGLGVYFVTNLLTFIILYIVALFDSSIMNFFQTTDTVDIKAVKSIMLIAVVVYVIYDTAFYFIGRALLNKGVNVD